MRGGGDGPGGPDPAKRGGQGRPLGIAYRHEVGLNQLLWGTDYPHLEGTWPETPKSIRHTFNDVPEDEARLMLGETAAKVFNFDPAALAPVVQRSGPTPQQILTPPTEDLFPRGDVNKPLSGATIF